MEDIIGPYFVGYIEKNIINFMLSGKKNVWDLIT